MEDYEEAIAERLFIGFLAAVTILFCAFVVGLVADIIFGQPLLPMWLNLVGGFVVPILVYALGWAIIDLPKRIVQQRNEWA